MPSAMKTQPRTKLIMIEITIFTLFITLSIPFSIFLKKQIQNNITTIVNLKPNSDSLKRWCDPPITAIINFHLFNITNPIEIITDPASATVHLQETRAYAYSIKTSKTNIKWSNDNKIISYAVEQLFTRHPTRFDPSSVNDTGVFLDLLRAIFRTNFGNKPSQAFYDLAGRNTFYYRNAVEQLEGFTSELFKSIQDKLTGPNTVKSGFIYQRNSTRLYNISIYVDQSRNGQLLTFASESIHFNSTAISHYPFPIYDGSIFPSMLFDKPELYIFNAEFCHPIVLQFVRNVLGFGGIKMREYKIKLANFHDFKGLNSNKPYTEIEKLDVSKCISNSIPYNTIYLSKAHFYGTNQQTIEKMNIKGLIPENDKYESYILFEPYSGIPLKVTYRMQLNIEVMIDPMKELKYASEFSPTGNRAVKRLIPIIWIDQNINIADDAVEDIRLLLWFIYYGQYFSMGLAFGLSIGLIIFIELTAQKIAKNYKPVHGC